MSEQFDLFTSRAARDAGIAQVEANAARFVEIGLSIIGALPPGAEVTGEDIRRHLTEQGVVPHDAHAWGALIRHAVRRSMLHDTGRYRHMRAVRSHARRTPLYRVI